MAGHIIKATIENTHPPVWRRIVIPEQITFQDLHEILRIAFQWSGYHMHEFVFPGTDLLVVMEQESDGEDEVDEARIQLDKFLTASKSIRYIYDFGDDWRHKIVFEKVDPAYQARFATILKYKGDSFMEDCGGVWAQGERVPFELGDANRRLSSMAFPIRKETKASKDFLEYLNLRKEYGLFSGMGHDSLRGMADAFQALRQMIGHAGANGASDETEMMMKLLLGEKALPGEEGASGMDEKLDQWWGFCDGGLSSGKMELLKMSSSKSCVDLLAQVSVKEGQRYCKYIGAPVADRNDVRQCAQSFWEELERHPEYLAYVFAWEEMEELLDFIEAPNGHCQIPDEDTMSKAISLGLFDLSQEAVNRKQYLALHQTREAGQLAGRYKRAGWKRRCEECARRGEQCFQELHLYQAMELEAFCEKYQEYFGGIVSRDEILRMVYLGGTFCGGLQTAVSPGGVAYVAEKYIDLSKMLTEQRRAGIDVEYRIFSEQEREESRRGFGHLYPVWGEYFNYLMNAYDTDAETENRWVYEQYQRIVNGEGADSLWEEAMQEQMACGIDDYVSLWHFFLGISLTTGLPLLRGHSREEYAKMKGISLAELGVYQNTRFVDIISKTTHLYEMPLEYQLSLYEAMERPVSAGDRAGADEMRALLEESGCENNEVMFLLMRRLFDMGEWDQAQGYIKALKKALPRDDGMRNIADMARGITRMMRKGAYEGDEDDDTVWDALAGKEMRSQTETYRREQPKVGRNDPCPCGSGKKYKKCCGK